MKYKILSVNSRPPPIKQFHKENTEKAPQKAQQKGILWSRIIFAKDVLNLVKTFY